MAAYRLTAEALRELQSGAHFYEHQHPGLGQEFVLEVRRLCRHIVEAPQLGTEVRSDVRRRLLRRFPYAILYALEDSEIVILAIAHQSRRPGYWTSRT